MALTRRGNSAAFEVLVGRYSSRLLAFCRHLLGSREDAEDVLQEVLAAAFNAMLADDRPINARPWLYRIARNRCLNHLRRIQAIGVDSMDIHFSEHGASTADKVHDREAFRVLVGDIHDLPETQKTALVLREMDALSYEQIAEAMETTVSSVKSLLVRARVSLAEAAEARLLSCEDVRIELGEVAEGLRRRPSPLVRRHLRSCKRCESFRVQLKETNKALAALMPLGPLALIKQFALAHLGHSAGGGATASGGAAGSTAAGGAATGAGAAVAGTGIVAGSGATGFISAGIGAMATKAAAGLAAAALVTGAAVEVDRSTSGPSTRHAASSAALPASQGSAGGGAAASAAHKRAATKARKKKSKPVSKKAPAKTLVASVPTKAPTTTTTTTSTTTTTTSPTTTAPAPLPGRTQTQTDPTVLPPTTSTTPASGNPTPVSSQPPTVSTTPPTPATTPPTTTTAPPPTTTTPPPPPPAGP